LHLGMALARTRSTKEARGYLTRLVEIEHGAPAYMRWVHDALVQLAMGDGKMAEAVQIAERGLVDFPHDENLMLAKASALYAMEEYVDAGRVLQSLIGSEPRRHMAFCAPRNVTSKLAPRLLGTVLRMQGAYLEAEAVLRQVLRDFPADRSTWYNLGLVYLDQGKGQFLAEIIRQLAALAGGAVDAGLLAALWHMRYGNLSLAGPIIDDLVAKAPSLAQPRMLRAEWLSRMRAPLDAQLRALRDVLRVQPGNLEALQWIATIEQLQAVPARMPQPAWPAGVVLSPGVTAS
jgi:tetratricopeptide (TPR) repeat protein